MSRRDFALSVLFAVGVFVVVAALLALNAVTS